MLFLGAGASKPLGVPTMEEFTQVVIDDLSAKGPEYEPIVRGIQADVLKFGLKPDIESVLTVLQGRANPSKALSDIGALVTLFSKEPQELGVDFAAPNVIQGIEESIYNRCAKVDRKLAVQLYGELRDYLRNNLVIVTQNHQRHVGQEAVLRIFTTNYDLSIETFLKRQRIPFNDGFQYDEVGDAVFSQQWAGNTNLYKLHGSINYYLREDGKIVRSDSILENADLYGREVKGRMMIYPTGEKYASRSPFYEYLGQLRQALVGEQVCIVIGYSFRDVPINNAFLDGVQRNPQLRILILGPSADHVRGSLDPGLQRNVRALNGHFGTNTMSPQSIVNEFRQNWL